MQQKLQFIATIIHRPDFLILDEPFSGLDPVNLDLIKGIMLAMRDEGKTVIFSTHMMEQAERLCDSILLINKGRKVVDGTLDAIRSDYRTSGVSVEVEGDAGFVEQMPIVRGVTREGKRLEILLEEGADEQEVLRALLGRMRVRAFEVKVPSLHEIFVHLVGNDDR
jgi:ABC-2 type transport system ATP-binding protein